jgi:DMSO/TMAO reductase YedYZ heme-binding membrane subunit
MNFLIVFVVTVIVVFAIKPAIQKVPWLFYLLAIAANALFIACYYLTLPRLLEQATFLLMQKCTLALALFFVVMFIGVFSRETKLRQWLQPIRAELSITAWLLSLGHMAMYLAAYFPRLSSYFGGANNAVLVSLAVACILFILLALLGVTSFTLIKRHMSTQGWKRLQMLAYPFFALVYLHLMLLLGPPALTGGVTAQISVAVYTVLFGSYLVLRVVRALSDRKAPATAPAKAGSATT